VRLALAVQRRCQQPGERGVRLVQPGRGGGRLRGVQQDGDDGVAERRRAVQGARIAAAQAGGGNHAAKGAVQQRVAVALGGIGQALQGEVLAPMGALVAVVPGQAVGAVVHHRIGGHGERVGGALPAEGGVQFVFRQLPRGSAPEVELHGDLHGLLAVHFQADQRVVGVYPEAQGQLGGVVAEIVADLAAMQAQFLAAAARLEQQRVGGAAQAQAADLEQPGVLAPGIALGQQQDQVTGGFEPGVQRQVAVAGGQRARGVGAGRRPDHVIASGVHRPLGAKAMAPTGQAGSSIM
jgi:hypothetical protein